MMAIVLLGYSSQIVGTKYTLISTHCFANHAIKSILIAQCSPLYKLIDNKYTARCALALDWILCHFIFRVFRFTKIKWSVKIKEPPNQNRRYGTTEFTYNLKAVHKAHKQYVVILITRTVFSCCDLETMNKQRRQCHRWVWKKFEESWRSILSGIFENTSSGVMNCQQTPYIGRDMRPHWKIILALRTRWKVGEYPSLHGIHLRAEP